MSEDGGSGRPLRRHRRQQSLHCLSDLSELGATASVTSSGNGASGVLSFPVLSTLAGRSLSEPSGTTRFRSQIESAATLSSVSSQPTTLRQPDDKNQKVTVKNFVFRLLYHISAVKQMWFRQCLMAFSAVALKERLDACGTGSQDQDIKRFENENIKEELECLTDESINDYVACLNEILNIVANDKFLDNLSLIHQTPAHSHPIMLESTELLHYLDAGVNESQFKCQYDCDGAYIKEEKEKMGLRVKQAPIKTLINYSVFTNTYDVMKDFHVIISDSDPNVCAKVTQSLKKKINDYINTANSQLEERSAKSLTPPEIETTKANVKSVMKSSGGSRKRKEKQKIKLGAVRQIQFDDQADKQEQRRRDERNNRYEIEAIRYQEARINARSVGLEYQKKEMVPKSIHVCALTMDYPNPRTVMNLTPTPPPEKDSEQLAFNFDNSNSGCSESRDASYHNSSMIVVDRRRFIGY